MSGAGETPADEDTGVANPENNEDNDAPNNSDADTEPAMLEEEEMPTYMSLTSSSRPDESRAELEAQQQLDDTSQRGKEKGNRAPSPCGSDEQGGGSIYVVSSGEESERAYEDEDYESDEMDMDEKDEEDDEDDSCPGYNEDEDESDGDIEPEQFERSSDDFVLRYDTNLEKHHKTRSRSLQDLTNSRGNLSRFVGKRRSIDIMGQYNPAAARPDRECIRDPLGEGKKLAKPSRYAEVPSKVKQYIQSIKEQNRRSAEHRNRENPLNRNVQESRIGNAEVSCTRLNPANRMIKGYAQSVINAMMELDHPSAPDVTYGGRRLGENGPKKAAIVATESKQTSEKDAEIAATALQPENLSNVVNSLAKAPKSNGILDYSTQNHSEKIVQPVETCTTNGQEQIAAIFNLRSLSYEEYANGDQTSSNRTEIDEILRPIVEEKNGLPELMEEDEVLGITATEPPRVTALKAESARNVAAVSQPTSDENRVDREVVSEFPKSASRAEPNSRDNPDVAMLWAMLNEKSAQYNEKTAQYDGIREAFQKTLTENISLKRELEELKRTLAQCRAENAPRATKAASVQTDSVDVAAEPEETKMSIDESKASTNDSRPPMPKLLSSSVGSALSSIEQWSDSNCSPAISINPPNMDHVLNSDDSLIMPERTPRRHPRTMSKSFITSSRILQTLANITQGRTKTASPLARLPGSVVDSRLEAEQGQSKRESENPQDAGSGPRARKRKASDMLGFSSHAAAAAAEPFKMPRTPEQPRKKINSDSDTDGVFKSRTGGEAAAAAPGAGKHAENPAGQPDDFEDSEATEVPENVKCFVYQEDSDSKERSFLIQAEEPSKSSDNGDREGGIVRECGPYLLGNVEIRMSEANGTINIWGKEVIQESSQESEYVDVEEAEVEVEVEEAEAEDMEEEPEPYENPSLSHRAFSDGQTPRARFINGSNHFVCSTNKKSKISSQSIKSSLGKYFRPAMSNLARANALANEGESARYVSSPVLNNRTTDCEQCESQRKRQFQCQSCDHLSGSRRKQHSCCRQENEAGERGCGCERGALDDDVIIEILTNILASHRKCSAAPSCHATKHSCANHAGDETCRHQNTCHRRNSEREADCHHAKKRCSSCADDVPTCNTRLTPGNASCCDKRSRSHSLASSCDDEEHPLLQNGHHETPETKRRRLSGKKVRGILTDLLRGCSGCRDHNSTSYVAKEPASLPNLNPIVRVTPATPTQPSCSKSSTACASHTKHPPARDAGPAVPVLTAAKWQRKSRAN